MVAYRRLLLLACLAGLYALGLPFVSTQSTQAQSPGQPPRVDRGKTIVIEPALKKVVADKTSPAPAPPPGGLVPIKVPVRPMDFGKSGVIEPRLKGILAGPGQQQQIFQAQAALAARPQPEPKGFVNPKVEPGKVKWHASFDEARAAAVRSKKPVLLFQMMGKLDDQFC
jgi:hypothetical protein